MEESIPLRYLEVKELPFCGLVSVGAAFDAAMVTKGRGMSGMWMTIEEV